MMSNRFSILQKGLALIVVPLLVQAVFTGVLLWRLASRNEVEFWALHTKEVIAQAETVSRVLVEADREVTAFAVTGDARDGVAFRRLLAAVPEQESTLGKLVSDNQAQTDRLQTISAQTRRALDGMQRLDATARAGDRDGIAAALRAISDAHLVTDIRSLLDGFIGEETKLDRTRIRDLRSTQIRQFWLALVGTAGLLLVSVGCAWVFGSAIVRRLAILNDNVRRIAAREPLGPPVGGNDEITALDQSFHQMVD